MEGCDILDVAATQPASEPSAATAPLASAPEASQGAQEPPAAAATAGPSGEHLLVDHKAVETLWSLIPEGAQCRLLGVR